MSNVERTDIYRAFDKETTRWLWLREQQLKKEKGTDDCGEHDDQ
jgi:hypothetical protein